MTHGGSCAARPAPHCVEQFDDDLADPVPTEV